MTTPYWSDFVPNSTFHRILSGFHRTFATGIACRQGTLTPPDIWSRPFGVCICSTCWDQSFFRTCRYFSGLCSSNSSTPRYFLDFASYLEVVISSLKSSLLPFHISWLISIGLRHVSRLFWPTPKQNGHARSCSCWRFGIARRPLVSRLDRYGNFVILMNVNPQHSKKYHHLKGAVNYLVIRKPFKHSKWNVL